MTPNIAPIYWATFLLVIASSGCSQQDTYDFKTSKNGDIIRTNSKTGEVAVIRNGGVIVTTAPAGSMAPTAKTLRKMIPQLGNITFEVIIRPPDANGIVKGVAKLSPRSAELIIAESKRSKRFNQDNFILHFYDENGISLLESRLAFGLGTEKMPTRVVDDKGIPHAYNWDIQVEMDAATFSSIRGLNVAWTGFE